MRNYLLEIRAAGMSRKAIAEQLGISQYKAKQIEQGIHKIKSGSDLYSKVRNLSRRVDYSNARAEGLSSAEASAERRNIIRAGDPRIRTEKKHVPNSKASQNFWQYYVYGKWQDEKTGEIKRQEGFSNVWYDKIDPTDPEQAEEYSPSQSTLTPFEQAINNARAKLRGSNWILIKILRQKWIEYKLS